MVLERERGRIIPWVFHRQGNPLCDFHTAWRTACRKAGVPGRLFHDLRRTAVRNLERAGVPRSWAMKLTGHLTESVYRRYAIVSERDLAEGVQSWPGCVWASFGHHPPPSRHLRRRTTPRKSLRDLVPACPRYSA